MDRLRNQLERYYRAKTDPLVEISDVQPISDGWETEVYRFLLTHGARPATRILRLYPGVDAVEKSTREYQGMTLLRRVSGYPVPSMLRHETDPAWLGKPFVVMQQIDGLPLGRLMREQPERAPELAQRFVSLLVRLHRVAYAPFVGLNAGAPGDFLANKLALAHSLMVEQLGQTWTLPALDWLAARQADALPARLAVLHGDFHPFNVLVTADDAAFVIDWGNIEVGDFRYDLAWTLLLAATQGGGQRERDQLLSAYEQQTGQPVEQIAYFEVIAALRRLLGYTVVLTNGAAEAGLRPEAADILRGQRPHFRAVYAILRAHTGLRLPEIERLLTE